MKSTGKGCTPAQLAIAWVRAQDERILPIPGMKTRQYLGENLGALDVTLSGKERSELSERIEQLAASGTRPR